MAQRFARTTVALVDGARLLLDGLVARLAGVDGIEVVEAETSWERLLRSPAFPPEVVVLDQFLVDSVPVEQKLQVLRSQGSRAVVMSRHRDPASVHSVLRSGAHGFVTKQESAERLVDAIRAAGRGEQYVSPTLSGALAGYTPTADPHLGAREHHALVLYARGHSIREVADQMATTEETVKSYIKRGRRKYRLVGVDLGSRVLLRQHAVREGWLSPDATDPH